VHPGHPRIGEEHTVKRSKTTIDENREQFIIIFIVYSLSLINSKHKIYLNEVALYEERRDYDIKVQKY